MQYNKYKHKNWFNCVFYQVLLITIQDWKLSVLNEYAWNNISENQSTISRQNMGSGNSFLQFKIFVGPGFYLICLFNNEYCINKVNRS